MPMATASAVTNEELRATMVSMLSELKALPRIDPDRIDQRLGGIEGQLRSLNGTVRENRENIIRLQNADATLASCVDRLEKTSAEQTKQIHILDISNARLAVLVTGGAGAGGLIGVLLTQGFALARTLMGQP